MNNPKEVYKQNLKEIEALIFQMNELNSREVWGKIFFCLKALEQILNI